MIGPTTNMQKLEHAFTHCAVAFFVTLVLLSSIQLFSDWHDRPAAQVHMSDVAVGVATANAISEAIAEETNKLPAEASK